MEITASEVKKLREKTGVGLMNCKKALAESNGDFEEAIKYLREKGLASASKKADRSTNEGRIFIADENNQAIILELNCETDFVAKNDDFLTLGNSIASQLLAAPTPTNESINADDISNAILKLGENIGVKQFKHIQSDGALSSYIHSNGKIGVVVSFSGTVDAEVGKGIAMHIAAANPTCIRPEDVDATDIENEKQIIRSQSETEGKPAEIIDKIVDGRINKYFKEVCLNEQAYIKDDKQTVKQLLPTGVTITAFTRFSLV